MGSLPDPSKSALGRARARRFCPRGRYLKMRLSNGAPSIEKTDARLLYFRFVNRLLEKG